MEQRIGSSSQPLKAEPVKGAGFDPAYIPGLTAPAPAEPADARPREAGEPPEVEDAAPENEAPEGDGPEDEAPRDAEPAEEPEPEAEPPADGPVFEAFDRRARIVADHRGIRLSLDDQECEFRWDEIGAVETETPRFGKRFTVTVHTPDRRWYPIEVDAPARARFAEWEKQLDAVLDAYFEDGTANEDAAEEPPAEDS
ncbi:hypothetical protein C1I97_36420 [Streptomyces sp. NTH33]|uniref:hypothetical protein n=1 Tax=Streptomyces sp. NTH33 TaxID=1735453 RepID=UPI000DA75E90|nr:hypothetical protein [Streptomyces sp. NTH33]PZG78721.1 hypothetical protein C1I97_36420 [Streptomyces sp. NTH33]